MHMCEGSGLTRKCVFCEKKKNCLKKNTSFPSRASDFFANKLFLKQCRKPHYMADCN